MRFPLPVTSSRCKPNPPTRFSFPLPSRPNPVNHTDPALPQDDDDTISLLDLLLVITENIKLLILGPIAIALIALAVTFELPQRYESESWLRMGEAAGPQFTSDDILIPLLEKTPWITSEATNREVALETLSKQIKTSFSKKDSVLKLTTQAPSPELAQQLNLALIDAYRAFSLPKGRSLEQIEQQIALTEGALKELGPIVQRVAINIDKVTPGTEGENVARAYISLAELKVARERALQDLNRQLLGFGEEVFAQSPSLPERPISRKRALVTILAGLASGMALLLFVFIRSAWRGAKQNPEDAGKIRRIRQSLGMKPSANGQG
jgi:hypothetical protein